MKHLDSVLASTAVAYGGAMALLYIAKEAKGSRLARSIAGAVVVYYVVMTTVYIRHKVDANENVNADSGPPSDQGDGATSVA